MLNATIRKLLNLRKSSAIGLAGKSWFDYRRQLAKPVGTPSDMYRVFDSSEIHEPFLLDALNASNMEQHLRQDVIPIPAPADRENYYDDRHFCYWLSGLYDYNRLMCELPDGFSLSRILDFGGSSGRVARHFVASGGYSQVTVADLNVNSVDWVEEYFPTSVRGLKVSSYPVIPLPDASIDLCYAFSVFTHIDAYESSWLAEIARLLRLGGRAYLTIHSEHTWSLLPGIYLHNALRENALFMQTFRSGKPMPCDRLVFEYAPDSNDYNCNVFHHTDHVRRHWGKWLNVVKTVPGGHGYQTVVVCERA